MKTANFYPGPSRVYSNIPEYIYEAYMDGFMSINHRSPQFMKLFADTCQELKKKQGIPEDYQVVFTSSATECWEIIAQSLTPKRSQHFYNGAFGEKWASYAGGLKETIREQFGLNETIDTCDIHDADVYCITQNETSNATQVAMDSMKIIREEVGDKLIAVDVTSSLGGIKLDFNLADVWYGSVQKCLGLPAGMGFMILSPRAVQVAEKIGENKHYNSLVRILENAAKDQTSYTPNVLDIYLLFRTQSISKGIDYVQEKMELRLAAYEKLFNEADGISFLVENASVRSKTVLALKTVHSAQKVLEDALERGIVLGQGYGPWKATTFRIANFPAIKSKEVEKLMRFFEKYY